MEATEEVMVAEATAEGTADTEVTRVTASTVVMAGMASTAGTGTGTAATGAGAAHTDTEGPGWAAVTGTMATGSMATIGGLPMRGPPRKSSTIGRLHPPLCPWRPSGRAASAKPSRALRRCRAAPRLLRPAARQSTPRPARAARAAS